MLAPTLCEEYHVVAQEHDYILLCDKCGQEIEDSMPYITKWNNDIMCADCIENTAADKILDFLGVDNIFDMSGKLIVLQHI